MRRTSDGVITPIRNAVDSYLQQHGIKQLSAESMVGVIWPEVVGRWYAAHTQVLRVKDGVVYVHCDSPARAQQLQLDTPHIVNRLNAALHTKVVRELRPSSGGIRQLDETAETTEDNTPPTPRPAELEQISLTSSQQQWIDETTAAIEEDALTATLRRLLTRACKLETWQLQNGYRPCENCGVLIPPDQTLCRGCHSGRIPLQGTREKTQLPSEKYNWGW